MTHLAARAGRLQHYQLHASIGYYLLLLVALRLAWRLGNAVLAGEPGGASEAEGTPTQGMRVPMIRSTV